MATKSWAEPELPFVHFRAIATRPGSPARYNEARPVAVPEDLDKAAARRASGTVTLPRNVRWSGPDKAYDLDDPADRNRVYEQVLREGTDDDVRRFVDPDVLEAAWDDLVLPARVRAAWADWFRRHRGVDLAC